MKPVLTASEMAAVDKAAMATVSIETLIARAGFVIALHASRMLDGAYGKDVVVVCGIGHNGDDGRVAARLLDARGARVRVLEVGEVPSRLPDCDLVIDAAFGTGFRGQYDAPVVPAGARVLAIDIPSGLHPDTGEAAANAVRADLTVTMGALKPGLLLGEGPEHAGRVAIEAIDLPIGASRIGLVEDGDLLDWLVARPRSAHKWQSAVLVIAGSPGTRGAASLCCSGASHAGSGMVRLGSPGAFGETSISAEIVEINLPREGFEHAALAELERCKAAVIGPGLGNTAAVASSVRGLLEVSRVPVVLDADALNCLGRIEDVGSLFMDRKAATVLTPHDGEFARLTGSAPGADRVAAASDLAMSSGAVVLLKGPTTVVAAPSGAVYLASAGSPALATAGSGDVLSGVIGAFLARGVAAEYAAVLAAHVHGRASKSEMGEGLVASDLPGLVARAIETIRFAS